MYLGRRIRLQLAVFGVITLVAAGLMAVFYLHVPSRLLGIGGYQVTVHLPAGGGLYDNANVTYRGTEVGRVSDVHLTPAGVDAVLSVSSRYRIPANLDVRVHSQTAVGEQYIELVPRSSDGPDLKNGDVIAQNRATLPPDVNSILSAANAGLLAIPHDNLKTAINEAYDAVGGLGPELSRIVKGTTRLAADARTNLDAITTLIDGSKPILDSQVDSSDAIQVWAANLAQITGELRSQDTAVRGILAQGPRTADEVRQLFNRLQPTVPILAANLVGLADVAVVYQANIEQILVLAPPGVEMVQASDFANRDTKQAYKGEYLSFNLNVNLPPPCTTGYLPANQMRAASEVDYPQRPTGDLYCRVPQDSALAVRGARNLPCETRPGKRAPTVKMCESDQNYVPLNDGYNWKGDPNATLSGQAVPQLPPIAAATYDPASGRYIGPDGRQYTQTDLAADAPQQRSWQDLLVPPKGH